MLQIKLRLTTINLIKVFNSNCLLFEYIETDIIICSVVEWFEFHTALLNFKSMSMWNKSPFCLANEWDGIFVAKSALDVS